MYWTTKATLKGQRMTSWVEEMKKMIRRADAKAMKKELKKLPVE